LVRLLGRYLNSGTEVERITRLCKRAASSHVERVTPTTVRGPARLTRQQNEQIAILYEAGRTPSEIALELGTTPGTVHHRLNRMGVERRPLGMTKSQIDEAVTLREQGTPVQEIAARLGFAYNTVRKELILRGRK
jgi:DNA-binding CsgD family transcriptional regulator